MGSSHSKFLTTPLRTSVLFIGGEKPVDRNHAQNSF